MPGRVGDGVGLRPPGASERLGVPVVAISFLVIMRGTGGFVKQVDLHGEAGYSRRTFTLEKVLFLMHFPRRARTLALSLGFFLSPVLGAQCQPPDSPIAAPQNINLTLAVDASGIAQKQLHARLSIPVRPGALTLVYPKWIPGEHGPTGPIDSLAGLVFSANGKTIPWRRDLQEMFAFHLTVPAGVQTLTVRYDFLLSGDTTGFSASGLTTPNLVNINWNQLVLYPAGRTADNVTVTANLRLPTGWQYGTALPVKTMEGDTVTFLPAPLVTLVDSPVLAGKYFKAIALTAPGVTLSHEIDMVSDSLAALQMPDAQIQHYKNLVAETGPLFGARHYRDYHFLYTLSDHVASFGLEHHESSDDRVGERTLLDSDKNLLAADLLPHEFVHSWNGKYRRPYDLYTPDYQKPMQDDLLWVYEGLTQYYGKVLSARSGLWTPQDFQDQLAGLAASLDHESGRTWRPLQDTADDAQVAYYSPGNWANTRRGVDFYDEMVLVWLEADTIIRTRTNGAKSLDDFCWAFHGGPTGMPLVKTYTFADVVRGLNAVAPYDWHGFLTERLTRTGTGAPLGGITNSGWKIIYSDTPSAFTKAAEGEYKGKLFNFSLGMTVNDEGQITDVFPGMPAFAAGLAPGLKIVAVNGRAFTPDRLQTAVSASKSAVSASKSAAAPLQIIAENGEFFQTFNLAYHGGLQYPHLLRDTAKPDLLTRIITPRVVPAPVVSAAAPLPG